MNTFRFGESRNAHIHGSWNCPACRWDTPQPCEQCQEGRVHIELNPKMKANEPVLIFHCDVCAGKGRDWKGDGPSWGKADYRPE